MSRGALQGQVALVTGGSTGIGAGVAKALGAAGAAVAVNYVSHPGVAEDVAGEIRALGGRAMTIKADVTDEGEVQAMFQALIKAWGTVDVLVNNAGLQKDAPCSREAAREM